MKARCRQLNLVFRTQLSNPSVKQFVRFLMVGLASLVFDVSTFCLLIWMGANSVVAATGSYLGSIAVNYTLHALYTFRAGVGLNSGIRYLVLLAFQYLITISFVYGFDATIGSPLTGKLISLVPVTLIGFFLGRSHVFHRYEESVASQICEAEEDTNSG